jgi:hypothetical protein
MATAAQIDANRANAQLSTGPVTAEGKARVAQNAVRHGLTAKNLVVREDEREELAALRDRLSAEIAPQGALECLAFDELLHAAWNLRRFRRIEAEASIGTLDDFTDPQAAAVLDRLGRYQARAQRAYTRALAELRALQTGRALRRARLEPDAAAEVPALADVEKLTKQTQSDTSARAVDLALKLVNTEGAALRNRLLHEYIDSPPRVSAGAQV